MNIAGLFDREVTLIHGALTFGSEPHFLIEGHRFEKLDNEIVHFVVEPRVDAVPGQHRESDVVNRRTELVDELRFVGCIAVKKSAEVERGDLVILIERITRMLGKTIGMFFLYLVVASEIAIECIDVGHGQSLPPEVVHL